MGWVGYTTSLTKIYVSQNSTLVSFPPDPGSSPEMKYSGETRAQSDLIVSDFEDLDFEDLDFKAAAAVGRRCNPSQESSELKFFEIKHFQRSRPAFPSGGNLNFQLMPD